MKVYLAVFLLCLYGCDQVLGRKSSRHRCSTDVCRKQCPLLEVRSNIVTTERFMSMITNREWLGIYSVILGSEGTPGKVHHRWSLVGTLVRRETRVFSNLQMNCVTNLYNFTVATTKCGVQLDQVDGERFERYFSQDLNKYFWLFLCHVRTADRQDCIDGFVFLMIRDTRAIPNTGEISLAGLPWGKIAADLKQVRNVDFDDNQGPKYIWLGEECLFP